MATAPYILKHSFHLKKENGHGVQVFPPCKGLIKCLFFVRLGVCKVAPEKEPTGPESHASWSGAGWVGAPTIHSVQVQQA